MTADTASVEQLFIYPVKSLRGIALQQSTLLTTGLPYDRYWMIVDSKHQFITQRSHAKLALIDTAIQNQQLILSYKKDSQVHIDIIDELSEPAFDATVWRDTCKVVNENEHANEWLSDILQQAVKLVRMQSSFQRPQNKSAIYGDDTHTYFADTSPYLICNQDSLAALNKRLQEDQQPSVSIENFRPNIVISGIKAFTEHKIKILQHANYSLNCCYPCQRCVIPTIDINTAEKRADRQPYKILSAINPMPDNDRLPAFGENAILKQGEKTSIHINDKLNCYYE